MLQSIEAELRPGFEAITAVTDTSKVGLLDYFISPDMTTTPARYLLAVEDLHDSPDHVQAMRDFLGAMEESLRINLQPVFLASATTAIGFTSMNFSEVPPFAHLGNIVSLGVIFSFVLTITFMPAVMTLLPNRRRNLPRSRRCRLTPPVKLRSRS